MNDERDGLDETMQRVVGELRTLPAVDPRAKARILEAVAAREAMPYGAAADDLDDDLAGAGGAFAQPTPARDATPRRSVRVVGRWARLRAARLSLPAAVGMAAAATFAGFMVRGAVPVRAPSAQVAAATPSIADTQMSGAEVLRVAALTPREMDEAPLPVQFVFEAPEATSVTLVGDFNEWNPRSTPMSPGRGGMWEATVELTPGRHTYAFLIDGKVWRVDPRAPMVEDDDFGQEQSVVIVGTP